ncbi:hypothetical protein FIBSPDRAFT_937690 [Athelia psychrophila]|uniref:Uncharacterized protein n=1 Tax=Athelia psychrophila TaxID=1759441 RepID=A0A166A0K5_9AGAM|nr:hypothetical protein FIBSPDRAFT_937690 [Fibularhizoctonia sp. CBS 109695]
MEVSGLCVLFGTITLPWLIEVENGPYTYKMQSMEARTLSHGMGGDAVNPDLTLWAGIVVCLCRPLHKYPPPNKQDPGHNRQVGAVMGLRIRGARRARTLLLGCCPVEGSSGDNQALRLALSYDGVTSYAINSGKSAAVHDDARRIAGFLIFQAKRYYRRVNEPTASPMKNEHLVSLRIGEETEREFKEQRPFRNDNSQMRWDERRPSRPLNTIVPATLAEADDQVASLYTVVVPGSWVCASMGLGGCDSALRLIAEDMNGAVKASAGTSSIMSGIYATCIEL